jgi:hypothetical protein
MSQNELHEIEIEIEDAKLLVARSGALTRLQANPDFQDVILDGYFKEEAVRLVLLKATPHQAGDEDQEYLVKQLDAIGMLHQYMHAVFMKGDSASRAIDEGEQQRAEILAEELT